MSLDQIFSVCSTLAMAGWIILIFLPFWRNRDTYVFGIIIIILSIVYAALLLPGFNGETFKSFGTLDGVAQLFTNKQMLLAGWVHYLAFDLLAGVYIVRNAAANNVNHWLTTPALAATFVAGPVGLLLYTVMRIVRTKKLFTGI
ncbi:MAG: DUF4281 domain-containing protein [Chitinophagaceae bacterium]|nr:MAG: DUF4281 domain-containing protein [Chitinophagaceae bacterium]